MWESGSYVGRPSLAVDNVLTETSRAPLNVPDSRTDDGEVRVFDVGTRAGTVCKCKPGVT